MRARTPSYKPASPPPVCRLGPPSSAAPRPYTAPRPAPLGCLSRPSWPSAPPLHGVPTPRRVPRPPQLRAPPLLAFCPAPSWRPASEAVCSAPIGASPRPSWPLPRPLSGVGAPYGPAVHVGAVAWDNQDPSSPMAEPSGRGGGMRWASALPSPDYYERVARLQQGLRDRYGLAGVGAGSRPAGGSAGAPPPTTVPMGRSPDPPCPPNSQRTEFTGDTSRPVGGPPRECLWIRSEVRAGVSCLSLSIKACEFLWSLSTRPLPGPSGCHPALTAALLR